MSKIDNKLFSAHEHALAKEYEICPKCGGELLVRYAKNGGFVGCHSYPECDYSRPLVQHENLEMQVIKGSQCPECGHELAVKSGRFGIFIGCTNYPDCHHIEKPEQDIQQAVACPKCNKGQIEQRTNRFGKSFYACNQYPKCKFLINYPPVAESCPNCGFALLVERNTASGRRVECPQKQCKFKRNL